LVYPAVSAEEELVRIADGYTYERPDARTLETMRKNANSIAVASGSRDGSACVKRFEV
jgi:hypothetical protein